MAGCEHDIIGNGEGCIISNDQHAGKLQVAPVTFQLQTAPDSSAIHFVLCIADLSHNLTFY